MESSCVLFQIALLGIAQLLWCFSAFNIDFFIKAYLAWVIIMHYGTSLRFLGVVAMRIYSVFWDNATSYTSYNGLKKTYNLGVGLKLRYWDIVVDFMAFSIFFGYYPSLYAIHDVMAVGFIPP